MLLLVFLSYVRRQVLTTSELGTSGYLWKQIFKLGIRLCPSCSRVYLQLLCTGGVRAFLEDEDQEALEPIWPIALDQEDEGCVPRSSNSYIRLVSWLQTYHPRNNHQRQAMIFFLLGLVIGFVLPLGRDVRNYLGVQTYFGWTKICAEVIMQLRSIKLDIELLLHMCCNLIATQWMSLCILMLAVIFIHVMNTFRNPKKIYRHRSRKRRFLHARRPGVAQLHQMSSKRKSGKVYRILATVCFLPAGVLVCLFCFATLKPLLVISTLTLKLCRWMYRMSCFVCISIMSVVISGNASTCLKRIAEKTDELCEVLGESSYYCWQFFCLALYIDCGSEVIGYLWACAYLGLWMIHVILLLFAIRFYIVLLIVGAYVSWLPWVLHCYYTIWVSVQLPLTILLRFGVRSFWGCVRYCINANGYILRLVILWNERLCLTIVKRFTQADILIVFASLVSVLDSPLGKVWAKCLVMLFVLSFHLPLIHCRMLSISSFWILLYSLPFINELNMLSFILVLLCSIWLWFHPSFPVQDGMDEPLFGDHDDSDEDKSAGSPCRQTSHNILSVSAEGSNRVTDDLLQRQQISDILETHFKPVKHLINLDNCLDPKPILRQLRDSRSQLDEEFVQTGNSSQLRRVQRGILQTTQEIIDKQPKRKRSMDKHNKDDVENGLGLSSVVQYGIDASAVRSSELRDDLQQRRKLSTFVERHLKKVKHLIQLQDCLDPKPILKQLRAQEWELNQERNRGDSEEYMSLQMSILKEAQKSIDEQHKRKRASDPEASSISMDVRRSCDETLLSGIVAGTILEDRNQSTCFLCVDTEDVSFLKDIACREICTCGDGACALHALFGDSSEEGMLIKPRARNWLRSILPPTWLELCGKISPQCAVYLEAVQSSMWDEFIRPFFLDDTRPPANMKEEQMFYDRLMQPRHADFVAQIRERLSIEEVSRKIRDEHTRDVQKQSFNVFRWSTLEPDIWRKLAVKKGMLPDADLDYVRLNKMQVAQLPVQSVESWLRPAWEIVRGVQVIKDTEIPFPLDGPNTRYAALFDNRAIFNGLRVSFLRKVMGEQCVDLQDILEDTNDIPNLDHLLTYCTDVWNALENMPLEEGSWHEYYEKAWPILVDCMVAEDQQYYFSAEETMLLADLCKENVIMFRRLQNRAAHYCGVLHHPCPITKWIVLQSDDSQRTRSHFQRLVAVSDIEERKKEVERQRREAKPKKPKLEEKKEAKAPRREAERKQHDLQKKEEVQAQAQDTEAERIKEQLQLQKKQDEERRMQANLALRHKMWCNNFQRKCNCIEACGDREAESNKNEVMAEQEEEKFDEKRAEWLSMFNITVKSERSRKHIHDLYLEVAEEIAHHCLRDHVTMPAHPKSSQDFWLETIKSGGQLPVVTCAFVGCNWYGGEAFSENALREDPEHPWDQQLRQHILNMHTDSIKSKAYSVFKNEATCLEIWDVYKLALSVKEQNGIPIVGASVDRRVFQYIGEIYNDKTIRALMCVCCPLIKVDTGRCRSKIQFVSVGWLLKAGPDALVKNFSMARYTARFRRSGTPLAHRESSTNPIGVEGPDFSDWQLRFTPEAIEEFLKFSANKMTPSDMEKYRNLLEETLLCNPEDHYCKISCVQQRQLCLQCKVPVCVSCMIHLQRNREIPNSLMNDNWYGYLQKWIFEENVTWMEKLVSSPYWTGMTLFSISRHGNRPSARHKMTDALYKNDGRIFFKGQIFSAPMDWADIMQQIEELEQNETRIILPITGQLLSSRVHLLIASGLVELNKHIREITVRRDIVVRLIQMHRDTGDGQRDIW